MIVNEKIGAHVKTLRESRKMTQDEFAALLNISQSAVQRMENGKTSSWADNLLKICNAFNVTPDEFISPITESWIQNNYDNANQNINVNLCPEKLIEQYEIRIQEKDAEIVFLRKKVFQSQ